MKSLVHQFNRLSARERSMIFAAVGGLICFGLYTTVASANAYMSDVQNLVVRRSRQLTDLEQVVKRYQVLSGRLEKAKRTFADSQMTFEQVTDQLDKIVQDSIGSRNYDLNRGKTSKVGLDYDKQDITVKVKSLTLEQMVKLLHRLEQGDTPLFLGKVDVTRSQTDNTFSAALEIFSIRKS